MDRGKERDQVECSAMLVKMLLLLFVLLTLPTLAGAISLGQLDDFEGGTTLGWGHSPLSPAPPLVVTDGTGNHYLEVTANGGIAAGGRLIAFNETQWTGNYLAAGVTSIEADVLTDFALTFRIALEGPLGTPGALLGTPIFASTSGATVGPSPSWQHVSFSLLPGDLSLVSGIGDPAAALGDVSRLRIVHNPLISHQGAIIAASFGLDNVTATVPEPATLWLAAFALLALPAALGMRLA